MANPSKRAKRATKSTVTSGAQSGATNTKLLNLNIPFQTRASLEHILDDVLHEILSYFPTFSEHHVLYLYFLSPPVIPSSALARTPILRALSQTSRLLRSRCLGMAWQRLELYGGSIPEYSPAFHKPICEITKAAITVLQGCPHLLPLIQYGQRKLHPDICNASDPLSRTVSVSFMRVQCDKIIPAFAACLAKLPNLTTIQVPYAQTGVMTAVQKGFKDVRLPSVRQILLACPAHDIIRSCPNVEEITSVQGDGGFIVGSILRAECQQLHTLKGVHSSMLKRLLKAGSNLRRIGFFFENKWDVWSLVDFPLLNAIELTSSSTESNAYPEYAMPHVQEAMDVLKKSKSQAKKTVVMTNWCNIWRAWTADPDVTTGFMRRLVYQE